MRTYHLLLASLLLASCSGGDSSSDGSVTVYDTDFYRSCDAPDNETLQESAQDLAAAGLDVLDSQCAILTGVAFIEVCGAPTGLIYIHSIRAESLEDANAEGYKSVERLSEFATDEGDVGTEIGYEVQECPSE